MHLSLDDVVEIPVKEADDLLDQRPALETLEATITAKGFTPACVALYGSWGAGKTNLMRSAHPELKDDHHVVWFDPWLYDLSEDVLGMLLLAGLRPEAHRWRFRSRPREPRGRSARSFPRNHAGLSAVSSVPVEPSRPQVGPTLEQPFVPRPHAGLPALHTSVLGTPNLPHPRFARGHIFGGPTHTRLSDIMLTNRARLEHRNQIPNQCVR